jgi:ATP-dependent exoDNAse (exonuclease V) alpha subunit
MTITKSEVGAILTKVLKYEHPADSPITKEKALQQDVILYKGLPVMAIKSKTVKKDDEKIVLCVNNESFMISDNNIDNNNLDNEITLFSIRTSEKQQDYAHYITIPTSEFHELFVMKYCSTTHKQQGDTIDKDIVIFDYNCMSKNLKYTAITRAKKLSQIHISY